jgi:putative endopeptidase
MKSEIKIIVLVLALALPFSVLIAKPIKSGKLKSKNNTTPPKKFIDPANMDLSIKPGDDFFGYANGNWIKQNTIPAKESRWGSFNILKQENTERLLGILNEVSKQSNTNGSLEQRVGDLFASGMDTLSIEKLGFEPLKQDFARIDKIGTVDDVIDEAVFERVNGRGTPLFGFSVSQDAKHVTRYIVQISQGGITLPDRDYYIKSYTNTLKIQAAYKQYIITLFSLIGSSKEDATKNATAIFNIEAELAKAQLPRVALRDPKITYNKFAITDLSKITTNLNWSTLLPKFNVQKQDSLIIGSTGFLRAENDLLTTTSIEDWKVYLKWNILKTAVPSLSSPFVNANFTFNSLLSGQKVQAPRNERVADLVDGSLGELLGQLYVAKYFTPAAKAYMVDLVNNLKVTLANRIQGLTWMSDATKAKALKKLNAFTVKIGYPDKWQNYDGLSIDRNNYLGNIRNISAWKYRYMVSQIDKPVDKTRWSMSPPTVNAYYSPINNEIVFPAGILQFPFFDFGADDAVNYGGIGAVIGHEMTHGFDDQGRQYDADGTLRNWWTDEDANKFKIKANQVVEQYNKLTVLDTLHVNGSLTLGENLADLGGLNIAYEAFKKTQQGQSTKKIDGFTPNQRFFLSWAQVWRGSQRPEAIAQRLLTDPHSPEQYRSNAPLTNIDAWYDAFSIKPGDKMFKKVEDRIKVW